MPSQMQRSDRTTDDRFDAARLAVRRTIEGSPIVHRPSSIVMFAGIFALALIVRLLSAWPLHIPGYFDAFYYYNVAVDMAAGKGMTDYVIWNYLDNPVGLPRPSHLYWMPMTTWVAWAGIEVLAPLLEPWRATQVTFAVLSSLLPALSAWLAWSLWRNRLYAVAAGVLTLFSGFYFIYWSVPDSFTPFALTVAVALLAAWRGLEDERGLWWGLAGIGVGLSHLTRADGVLVGIAIGLFLLPNLRRRWAQRSIILLGAGYLVVTAPWFWRNWELTGAPFASAGSKTIWLRSYEEIFSYNVQLEPTRYLAWGILPIVISKLKSLLWNGVVVVGGLQFFLAPFAAIGAWNRRQSVRVRLVTTYFAILLVVMVLVFTFPSQRGSTLHSAAAFIPWLSAFVPAGVATTVRWVAQRRSGWQSNEATRVFVGGFVVLAMGVSLWLYAQAVWLPEGPTSTRAPWNQRFEPFTQIDQWMTQHNVSDTTPVFVNDPPAFYGVTGRRAIILPSDGPAVLDEAADEYNTEYLVLGDEGASPYREAYRQGTLEGWEQVASFEDYERNTIWLFRKRQ